MAPETHPRTRRRDSRDIPSPALQADGGAAYTTKSWDEDCFHLFAEGSDPGPCPSCGQIGFYGPRVGGQGRRYRACRFCGFHQDVGAAPSRAHPTVHGCSTWPHAARAPYIWWLPPEQDEYTCPFCETHVALETSRVTAPIDDPGHPWWKVPQARSRFYYARFWENWPCTKGRVFL